MGVKQRASLLLLLVLASCSVGQVETGFLQGQVTVGPLVPVVGPRVEAPTPGPEVFAGRKVVIYEAGGERVLQQVELFPDGGYRVELPAGSYVVDINHLGIDSGPGLPAVVEIRAYETTVLDIEIDTGIR